MIDQDIWALMDSGMLYDPADPALKDVQQSRLAFLNEFILWMLRSAARAFSIISQLSSEMMYGLLLMFSLVQV